MTKPLTASTQIVEELTAINTKVDMLIEALPKRPKQLTEEEKAVFIRNGVPVPETVQPDDPVLDGIKNLTKIDEKVEGLTSYVKQLGIGVIVILVLLILSAVTSFDGCSKNDKVSPVPEPTPKPAGVIQLDKTEYGLYQYAVNHVEGDSLAEKKESLSFLLGAIPVKKKIVEQYPNEKIEVLP